MTPEIKERLGDLLHETFPKRSEFIRGTAFFQIHWGEEGRLFVGDRGDSWWGPGPRGVLKLFGHTLLNTSLDIGYWDDIVGFVSVARGIYDKAVEARAVFDQEIGGLQVSALIGKSAGGL